jgi:hypothetical protein
MSDVDLIAYVPAGYRVNLVAIALAKRALLTKGCPPAEKLSFLEFLNAMPDSYLSADMVAVVEPIDDVGYRIVEEAMTLDPPDDKAGAASCKVLSSARVFGHLIALNPSILKAIALREGGKRCQ